MQIHASCVARDDGGFRSGLLLIGASGSGKSDLALRLIDHGFTLIADDQVVIDAGEASAPVSLRGLLEVRGLGLVRMPFWERAPLALVVRLGQTTARLPDPTLDPLLNLPMVRIDATMASAVNQVALALVCARDPTRCRVGAFA